MNLITCADFAQRMHITDRAARNAFAKAEWRGHKLPVTQLQDRRGGAGGACWGLHAELCSPELRALLAGDELAVSTAIEGTLHTPLDNKQVAVARDRQRIIAPILKTSSGSPERAQAFRETAAQPAHQIAGTLRPVAERTLREWVNETERKSVAALLPKARKDRGVRRVQITRAWDSAIGLDEATQEKLAAEIERLARSMVTNDWTSTREVLRLCSDHLARASAEVGSPLPVKQLRRMCALNPKWAKRVGLDRFRLVHDKDHKTWQDKAVPRVRRDLHDTPMGLLIGDVHYVDMLVEEGDQPIRVRLIAWMDAANMFAWVTPERPLEALRERAVQGQSVALPPCTVPITEHRRQHRSGRPPVIDSNPVLQAFIVARLDRLTFKEIADDIARHFPADQHLHQSTIHRWSQKRR
ncbi:hypothetical protein EYE42_04520 [Paracoccus subflavus]|uniref:Uncharacterized protein n=1 Tax=Paracoccus subflavus TaxID=2528244 RepID=A0A4Q9G5I5_9RHOB|nr:hypothetical protein [Paracoccus subflavus]TBN42687.1 hypothetical protein EYE42_04520 [Paracoccus subflavus]